MLNNYIHEKDDTKQVYNKRGYIYKKDTNKVLIKYYLLNRQDIAEKSFLKNVVMSSSGIIVRTKTPYSFDIHDYFIDALNKKYMVTSIYTEERDNSNGLFRNSKPIVYLVLEG